MVSLAGIMANITIAVVTLIIIKILQRTTLFSPGGALESVASPVGLLLEFSLYMNASLAVFNLLPFPPLDGSKILYSILPSSMHSTLEALEQYGFIILMAAIYFGVFRAIFKPVAAAIDFLVGL
jgi:Zn-dependent protease